MKDRSLNQQPSFAVCSTKITEAARAVQLFPAGRFRARDGRPHGPDAWSIDAAVARRLIDRASARQTPFIIDYEHQTLLAEKNGQPAPRAATFTELEWREGDGLYAADVAWTKRARDFIESDEYGFISPVFSYDRESGEVLGFMHAALTNDPALDGMAPVAARAAARYQCDPDEEIAVMASKLGNLLGRLMKEKNVTTEQMGRAAGIDAGTVSQILRGDIQRPPERRLRGFARVLGVSLETLMNALPKEAAAMNETLSALLGIEDEADDNAIGTAVAALKAKLSTIDGMETELAALKSGGGSSNHPDPSKFVPVEAMQALQDEVAALRTNMVERRVNELVSGALDDGRLLPAQEQWARDLGAKDIEVLKSFIDNAQPIAALKGTQTDGKAPENESGVNGDELAVCRAMGIDPEDFKKAKEVA